MWPDTLAYHHTGLTRKTPASSQELSSRRKLGLLAEPQPVHAPAGASRPIPPPLLPSPSHPATTATAAFTAPTALVPRPPHHPLADLDSRGRVFESEAPRNVAQVERPDLEHRSAVRGTSRVGTDVALERRTRAVQKRLVAGHEELQSLLELVRQLRARLMGGEGGGAGMGHSLSLWSSSQVATRVGGRNQKRHFDTNVHVAYPILKIQKLLVFVLYAVRA